MPISDERGVTLRRPPASGPLRAPVARWLLVLALAFLGAGVVGALGRAPGVFPVTSLWFWSSTGLAVAALGLVAVAAVAAWRAERWLLAASVVAPAGVLAAVGLTGRVVFPSTPPRFWAGLVLLGGLWLLGFSRSLRGLHGEERWRAWSGLAAGLPWGVVWVLAQVPLAQTTRAALWGLPPPGAHAVTADLLGEPGVVRTSCGPARLELRPLLTFHDSSRDGFWPGVAPTRWEGPPLLEGPARRAQLEAWQEEGAILVDAATELPMPVHAHLVSFADVFVDGLATPRLRFAAVPERTFDVLPFDYPHGRPAQFAFLSPRQQLEVARGADAEKGPFTRLGAGPLAPGAPLELEVLDGARPVCSLTFLDFTAQASLAASPTAGEGVPVNVIQFGQSPLAPGRAALHLSLAETGIGAGRATTTHAAGVYRNRVRLAPR